MFRNTESNQGKLCPTKVEELGNYTLVTGGGFEGFTATELACDKDCQVTCIRIGGVTLPFSGSVECKFYEDDIAARLDEDRPEYTA